ncbi:amino acid ABC transporter permease [Edaphobacillus lindanitolerans]|uniref:Amino acid ABC transporter membrane protein 2, PAAT family n=1 Tax=Edaphobacillus lindanitolerans TaxID=550447 RepID=A0A1U7PRG8_9BACI|nr:amino acid ABC transporter permease [Edaphobacillus lindanitolerans]SIT92734.1 amino acid ABC transporter membrane protein 2, PAAT family [Edaphobacillus lindanitolerans]
MQQSLNIPFLIDTFFTALSGVPITLAVTAVAMLIAVPAGFLLALSRVNEVPVLREITKVYVSFVRGTPIIVQIFITYASVPLILTALFEKYGIQANVYELNPIWYAFIVFSFSTTAILSEVFRSALSTVDRGQLEAAWSVGLTGFQSFRRIIIPQALVSALPNLATATVNLIKATSLGYALSLQEITLKAKVAANAGYNYIEAYIDIFLVYLILCSVVEFAFKKYEQRAARFRVQHV